MIGSHWLVLAFIVTIQIHTYCQLPQVTAGTVDRIADFKSAYVSARTIDVWLPPGYSTEKKYNVLYMHDGQMLYDSATTWNRAAWDVDDIAGKLLQEGLIKDLIIVGVWNGGATRHIDYFPQKPFESMTSGERDTVTAQLQRASRTNQTFKPVSDNYLKFLVLELKPFIDNHYSTLKKREATFIAGSSMGGLISLYAICEYPKVFGGAACMSTHWPGTFAIDNNPVPDAFCKYLKDYLPDPGSHKIYFDYGDQTLDALYPLLQHKVDQIMREHGYSDQQWVTRFFPGEDHSENAWRKRFAIPLTFLMKK